MKRITHDMLKQARACPGQRRKFKRVFPNGAPVSMRSITKAREAGLDVTFCAYFLKGPVLEEYTRATGKAWSRYMRATRPARKRRQGWEEYLAEVEPQRTRYMQEYDAALLAALAALDRRTQ